VKVLCTLLTERVLALRSGGRDEAPEREEEAVVKVVGAHVVLGDNGEERGEESEQINANPCLFALHAGAATAASCRRASVLLVHGASNDRRHRLHRRFPLVGESAAAATAVTRAVGDALIEAARGVRRRQTRLACPLPFERRQKGPT